LSEKRPKVSVIIPAFREEKYIGKLLENLLKLKPEPEVIVVTSGDYETARVARRYTRKVFVIEEYGISVARNYGAKKARGEILLFLDADVSLPEDSIETLVRIFQDRRVVGATCKIMPQKSSPPMRIFFTFYNLLIRLTTFFKPHSRGEFLAVRREAFFEVGGFNEEMRCIEDHDLAIRLSRFGVFKFIKDLTVYESMRRFRRLGFMKVIKSWVINYCTYIVNGRPLYNQWRPVR